MRGKVLTPERKVYYESVRKHKTQEYIRKNRRVLQNRLHGQEVDGEAMLEEVRNIIKTKV